MHDFKSSFFFFQGVLLAIQISSIALGLITFSVFPLFVTFLEPVYGIILAFFILNEISSLRMLARGTIIISAAILSVVQSDTKH